MARELTGPTYLLNYLGEPTARKVFVWWCRVGQGTTYHLHDANSTSTLCGRQLAPGSSQPGRIDLPVDAGRFPCLHCTLIRKQWYSGWRP